MPNISDHFTLEEFNGVYPDPRIIEILEMVRNHLNDPVIITDSARTFAEHIMTYKNRYGPKWPEHIKVDSRHLPSFKTPYLRAVDFKVKSGKDSYYSGEELKRIIEYFKVIPVGIGVGKHFVHLDVDREEDTFWTYDY